MKPLTLIINHPYELHPEYLSWCLDSLVEWNAEGLKNTQVIVLSQHNSDFTQIKATRLIDDLSIYKVDQQYAKNGYPIWDVMAALRAIQDKIVGKYICVMHSEFIWCRDRLQATIDWLLNNKPILALGNLRRPGNEADAKVKDQPGCSRYYSERILNKFYHDWDKAAWLAELQPSMPWLYWYNYSKYSEKTWLEDVFFANFKWLQTWKAFEHGGMLPFQDIFDLIGESMLVLATRRLSPPTPRIPIEINRLIHLWHPKAWDSWVPEVRDWFMERQDQWKDTVFTNPNSWNVVITKRTAWAPISDFRQGHGGTLIRYTTDLVHWLNDGGIKLLQQFYCDHANEV
jgi:hypothetical protein